MLVDAEIKKIQEGTTPLITKGWVPDAVQDVFLDLSVDQVVLDDGSAVPATLHPGEFVFVKTAEEFRIPDDTVAFIHERTSAIRLGLNISGTSPLKPGFQGACFIRVTNLSARDIKLEKGLGIAQVCFFRLERAPESPYSKQRKNHFQNETAFRGLGGYESEYAKYMAGMAKQKDELEKMQGRIYANVVSILGVFSAIVALLVTNVQAFSAEKSICQVVQINIAIVASILVLMLVIKFVIKK